MSFDVQKNISRKFQPNEPLKPGDPCYVDYSSVRNSSFLIGKMANRIHSKHTNTYQLLSGHTGCGKSTELALLQEKLVSQNPRYFVVYCEADNYIDINDVEYTDILLAVVHEVWKAANNLGIKIAPSKMQQFLDGLEKTLSFLSIEDSGIDFLAKLAPEIKRKPSYRGDVRNHLRSRDNEFLETVNEVIQLTDEKLRAIEKDNQGVVVIVDNLDRIYRKQIKGTNDTSYDLLFINHSESLCKIKCHMIYTIPPTLCYSRNGSKLASLYNNPPELMPMIPVTYRSGGENKAGMDKLAETIQKRIENAGSKMDEVFESEQSIQRLCSASGGYVRNLLILFWEAVINEGKFPITHRSVEQAIRALRDRCVDAIISSSNWEILRRVHKTKSIDKTEEILQLLDNLSILEYCDDDGNWYDVNPLLRESRNFKE